MRTKFLLELIVVTNQIVRIIDGFFKYKLLTFDQRQLESQNRTFELDFNLILERHHFLIYFHLIFVKNASKNYLKELSMNNY